MSNDKPISDSAQAPVCWITKEQLGQIEDLTADAWVYWRETGHVAEDDEVALYAAPVAPAAGAQPDERTAFDDWARDIRMDVSVSLEGHYTEAATAYAWAAWQARAVAPQTK